MKTRKICVVAAVLMASGIASQIAPAQQAGLKRTDLQRHDLSIPAREVVQALVEVAPGVAAPKHTHPGEEIIYVVEGSLEYEVEGKPPMTLKAGEVLFIPYWHGPLGEERRQRKCRGACDICGRERKTARRPGAVSTCCRILASAADASPRVSGARSAASRSPGGLSEIAALGLPEPRQINRHQSTPSLNQWLPKSRLELIDGGHFIWEDAADTPTRRWSQAGGPKANPAPFAGDTIVDERLSALLNKRNTVDHVRTELPFAL